MKSRIVTTSWDDGDPLDLRVAKLLSERNMAGTFYVPIIGYRGRTPMQQAHIRHLVAGGFEIGAHSYSHRSLRGMQALELRNEVRRCRDLLEDYSGQPVNMFCYPNGRYDHNTVNAVRDAGYLGARTTRMLRTDAGDNPFAIPTTVQAFPHRTFTYLKNTLKGGNFRSLMKYSPHVASATSWIQLGMRTFDHVLMHGGVWHLYGHSWELEEHQLWYGLRALLDYVSNRKGVQYLNNDAVAQSFFPSPMTAIGPAA